MIRTDFDMLLVLCRMHNIPLDWSIKEERVIIGDYVLDYSTMPIEEVTFSIFGDALKALVKQKRLQALAAQVNQD